MKLWPWLRKPEEPSYDVLVDARETARYAEYAAERERGSTNMTYDQWIESHLAPVIYFRLSTASGTDDFHDFKLIE